MAPKEKASIYLNRYSQANMIVQMRYLLRTLFTAKSHQLFARGETIDQTI
jgi:hypothetical protein